MISKPLKQNNLLEQKIVMMNSHQKMHLKNKESLKTRLINLKNPVKPKNLDKEQKNC